MESGVRKPEPNTPSPSRVTSRSSCSGRRRPPCNRAIFNRTELEPISTAAKVGMGSPTVYMRKGCTSPPLGIWRDFETRELGCRLGWPRCRKALAQLAGTVHGGSLFSGLFLCRANRGHGIPELSPCNVVNSGHERRLIDFAQRLRCGLRQGEPVMPAAERILRVPQLRNQFGPLGRLRRELRRIPRLLHGDTVPVQQLFVHRTGRNWHGCKYLLCNGQWIAALRR